MLLVDPIRTGVRQDYWRTGGQGVTSSPTTALGVRSEEGGVRSEE